jgi:hypothetical protein
VSLVVAYIRSATYHEDTLMLRVFVSNCGCKPGTKKKIPEAAQNAATKEAGATEKSAESRKFNLGWMNAYSSLHCYSLTLISLHTYMYVHAYPLNADCVNF